MSYSINNSLQDEIRRLKEGPAEQEKPAGLGIVRFKIACNKHACEVMKRAKEVMLSVDINSREEWPSEDQWGTLLPDWFTGKCAPQMTKEEAQRHLKKWRKMSAQKQAESEAGRSWSLMNWLYWFRQENRTWFWWDTHVQDENTILLSLEVRDQPFPSGALRWLFIACGAKDINEV